MYLLLQRHQRLVSSDRYHIFGRGFEALSACFDSHYFPARVRPGSDGADFSIVSLVSSVDDESESSDLEGNVLYYFLCWEAQLDCASDCEFLAAWPCVFCRTEQCPSIVETVLQFAAWNVLFSNYLADLVSSLLILCWRQDESPVRLR